ncbi:sterol desaturase family protein [Pontixanthobacter gangjinensis]|uniref:Sterol desaturase family protein n=1 Tax=Pontixanthobacter gangjinensis TaxID=1028742 RepID=A0A6I4SLL8_9SPHN|nr:sterol desaturase family protein [Pontixanthobacter gangjinensis]MXO56625.1 sterol desaturase family protein [Pontixanthobacter gangjinensis]
MTTPTETTFLDKVSDHIVTGITLDLTRYMVAASLMTVLLLVFKRWADNRRIQKRRAIRSDYIREFFSSMRTVVVFAITTITTLVLREYGYIEFKLEGASVALIAFQFAIMVLAHDAYFYWMHRALHHKRLYKATHLHHHKSRTPTPWTSYSFATAEAVTESIFMPIFLLAVSTLGVAYAGWAIFFFLWHMIFRNVMAHAGVELFPAGWTDSKWTDWISTTTHHDLHHSEFRHNYGFYFTFWDRWMGTEHPQYKARFNAVAKPTVMTRRFAAGGTAAILAGLMVWSVLPTGIA